MIAIAGWGIHLPGLDDACPPERAGELLGSRGLLNKEPATRLALCAVHRALGLPPRAPRSQSEPDPRVAVVASSNLGNVATVQAVARTVRTRGLKEVSALDAPNASSNVLASSIAIWFRLGGPNLMVCSGPNSGSDAIFLATVLLRTHRADRVIVAAAEPDDPVAAALHPGIRAGAAAVILDAMPEPRLSTGRVGSAAIQTSGIPLSRAISEAPDLGGIDVYGANGVLRIALAAAAMGVPR